LFQRLQRQARGGRRLPHNLKSPTIISTTRLAHPSADPDPAANGGGTVVTAPL
jgi:hypothetical protein